MFTTTPNIGIALALVLVMASTQFKDRRMQKVCWVLAPVIIMTALNMFTLGAWKLYSPALFMLFGLFTVYTKGEAKMISLLVTLMMFTSFIQV